MRRPEGVTIISVYHFIVSLPLLIGACAIVGVPISGALQYADDVGRFWALFGLGLAFLFVLGFALVGIIAGWGLLRLKSWARWLTVILSVLSLPLFPIGTLIGAVIIWYLLQDHVRLAFETGGVETPMTDIQASSDLPEPVDDLPYVIGSEVEDATETLLDAEEATDEIEEVVADTEQTIISVGEEEPQTLVAEVEEVVEEVADEVEEAAPATIILSEDELSEAQEEPEAAEDKSEDE